jgi:hypothetical protein
MVSTPALYLRGPDENFGLQTGYPHFSFMWYFLAPWGKCWDSISTLNYAMTASLNILSIHHSRYLLMLQSELLAVPLNKHSNIYCQKQMGL